MLAALFWLVVYGVVLLGIYLALTIGQKRSILTQLKAVMAVIIMVIVAIVVLIVQLPQLVYSGLYPGVHEQWPVVAMILATILWFVLLLAAYPLSFYLYLAVDIEAGDEFAYHRRRQLTQHSQQMQLRLDPRPRDNDKKRQRRAAQAARFFDRRQRALEKRRSLVAEWWWLIAIITGLLLAFAWPYAPLAVEFDGNVR